MHRDLNEEQLKQAVTLTLPLSAVLRLADTEPARSAASLSAEAGKYAILDDCLPAIGEPFRDGVYAGITIDGTTPMALVLLPGEDELPWVKANEWAAAKNASLPTRVDALLLWQNLPKEFKKEWYWTREQYAGYADYARIQSFDYGSQSLNHKSSAYRCRAVRRVPI